MLEVTTSATTSLKPDQVIAAAADFSDAREKLWPNSKNKYLHVHDRERTSPRSQRPSA